VKIVRAKKGQFIVIAALMLSIMIISISTVIYGTVTYFRHERWEEYVTILDSVKTGSSYMLEISLAKYSQAQNPTQNQTILRDNLNQWIRDVRKAYPGFGVDLSYSLAAGIRSAYGMSPNYNMGLNYTWNRKVSYSAANATFNMNIASVGLTGYSFSTHTFLKMNIADALWYTTGNQVGVRLVIEAEGPTPVTNLQKGNFLVFRVDGVDKAFTLYRYYDSRGHPVKSPTYPALNAYVFELRYNAGSRPTSANVVVSVKDSRGIQVTGAYIIPTSLIIDY